MDYNLITPFFIGAQGKLPSYMANFLVKCLSDTEVTERKKILSDKVNIVYPIEYFPVQLKEEIIFFGPDNALMLFKRALFSKDQYIYIKVLCLFRYLKFFHVYRKLNKNVKILTVGQSDCQAFIEDGFTNVHYFPHPVELPLFYKKRHERTSKVVIGISGALGRFGLFYCGKWYHRLTKVLQKRDYQTKIKFVVLGKQYKNLVRNLQTLGYEVEHTQWADNYQNFLDLIDIYMCLMAVGAGTKNRVLAANAAGLRVLGTEYALENIKANNIIVTAENFKQIIHKVANRVIGHPLKREEWERFRSSHSEKSCKDKFLEKIK